MAKMNCLSLFVACLMCFALVQAYPNRWSRRRSKTGGSADAWGDHTLAGSKSKVTDFDGWFESMGESTGVATSNGGASRVELGSYAGSDFDLGLGKASAGASGGSNSAAGHSSVRENNKFRGIGSVGVSAVVCLPGDTQCTVASSAGTRDRNIGVNVGSGGGCSGGVCAGTSVSSAGSLQDKRTGRVDSFGNSMTSGISLS